MDCKSFDVVGFNIGPLLQGQMRIAKLKSGYNSLIIGPRGLQYRNKRRIRVLYDGFKLSSGYIKATKPEGLSALIQQIDSLNPS